MFSYCETVAGRAQVVDRQIFEGLITRPGVQALCDQIAQVMNNAAMSDRERQDAVGALKRRLPAFCWHAWFDDGVRKNDRAHPSGLVMIDLDHLEEPKKVWEGLVGRSAGGGSALYLQGHRLLAAHITPSTQGLRLVFVQPEGTLSLEDAQAIIARDLGLTGVDTCTKDLARLSFCVPKGYWLWVDAGLFEVDSWVPHVAAGVVAGAGVAPVGAGGVAPVGAGGRVADGQADPNKTGDGGVIAADGGVATTAVSSFPPARPEGGAYRAATNAATPVATNAATPYPACYELKAAGIAAHSATGPAAGEATGPAKATLSIPYPLLVEKLQEQLGGVPAHGSRNNFIFAMAAYLRYVCDDDPAWIAQVLPTYGENRERWRRTIDSACQRSQLIQMPQIVHRAIAQAAKESSGHGRHGGVVDGEVSATDDLLLPPPMPRRLPKLIAHLVKNVPEVCRPAVANAVFPALAAHLKGVKFWLIDGTEKEATFMCVTMAPQSSGKSAVNKPIEYIVADIVERDELSRQREQEWKDAMVQKGANKEKPPRPDDLCVQVLVSDMTNAAFVQRMKDAGGRYLYTNLEELDLLRQLQTNGTKDVGKIICLCFDNGKYGQERVGTQSVTARVDLRWNWNAASTIQKGIRFFKERLVDGTLSRINLCTIVPDASRPFVYGRYDDRYAEVLKPYIANLNLARGHVECRQALSLARQWDNECLDVASLTCDDTYQDLSHRAVTIAYLKAMVLFIANGQKWGREIGEFAAWSLQYDLWCKSHFFGPAMAEAREGEAVQSKRGRRNLLELLPTEFTRLQADEMRRQQGLKGDGSGMLRLWVFRGYVVRTETGFRKVGAEPALAAGDVGAGGRGGEPPRTVADADGGRR